MIWLLSTPFAVSKWFAYRPLVPCRLAPIHVSFRRNSHDSCACGSSHNSHRSSSFEPYWVAISLAALASATDFSPSSVRDGHQVRGGAKVFVSSEFFLWLARDGEALGLGSVALPFHNTANSSSLGIFHYYRSDTAVSSLSNRTSRKMPMLEIALCDSVRFSFNVFELCKCLCCCGVLLLLMMRVVKATYTQNYWCSHSTDTDSARVYVTDLVDKKINKK